MIVFLRGFFTVVLVSMLGVTFWAGSQVALWDIPRSVGGHPWFIATLFDTYWAFFTFFCWVYYRENTLLARLGWFVGVVLLGNIAMASYMLILLFRLPVTTSARDILLKPANR